MLDRIHQYWTGSLSVKDIVTQHKRHTIISYKLFPNNSCFGKTIGLS